VTETSGNPDNAAGAEIVTEGSGWHEQPGDRAELDVTFSAVARTRADAVRDLGRRMTGATQALELPGLEVRHRRVWVHNEWRGNRVVGCRAGEYLALLVVDVTALEPLLSALIGAEPTDLQGPRWVLADPTAARLEAQKRAVDDARRRAEGYAAALGGALGPLRRLSEVAEHAVPMAMRTMRAAEAAGPDVRELGLEPEPVRVTARCTTTWTLLT
jgi:uncharacterized protein